MFTRFYSNRPIHHPILMAERAPQRVERNGIKEDDIAKVDRVYMYIYISNNNKKIEIKIQRERERKIKALPFWD